LTKEKTTLDGDITKLRDGLSNNTTTQTVDKRTGQLITMANNANRKSFEGQLKEAQTRRDTISKKIDAFNDSITKLDVQILDMQSQEISGSELGAIKYISDITGWGVKQTANIFILILIFVFDPLAITLVIATNQAFKGKRKEDDSPKVIKEETKTHLQKEADRVWETVRKLKEEGVFPEQTEEEKLDEPTSLAFTPYYEEEDPIEEVMSLDEKIRKEGIWGIDSSLKEEETDQVPTNYRPSTDEVEEYFEDKNYDEIITKDEVEEEKESEDYFKVEEVIPPKRLTYEGRNGGNLRINRF